MLARNFFLEVFRMRHERWTKRKSDYSTRSLNRHKNTTAIRTDKLIIASTHHGNRTALRISNDIRFSVIFPCARHFWRDRSHTPTVIWNYILHTKSTKCTCYV